MWWSNNQGTGKKIARAKTGDGRIYPRGLHVNISLTFRLFACLAHFAAVWHQETGLHVGPITRGQERKSPRFGTKGQDYMLVQ